MMKTERKRIKPTFLVAITILLVGGGCQEVQDEFQADLSDQKVVRVKEGTLHFPNAEIFENYMLGKEDYTVVDEDSFESLFSLAGNQLRSNTRILEAGINAIPFEFRLTPINR